MPLLDPVEPQKLKIYNDVVVWDCFITHSKYNIISLGVGLFIGKADYALYVKQSKSFVLNLNLGLYRTRISRHSIGNVPIKYYLGVVVGRLDLDDWYDCRSYLMKVFKKIKSKYATFA